jgi:hypothetical protein
MQMNLRSHYENVVPDDKVPHGWPWQKRTPADASHVLFEKKHNYHHQNHYEEEAGADHNFPKT